MKESLKVQSHHLERGAYLYIRQSSMLSTGRGISPLLGFQNSPLWRGW
jgi:hypothetical protein